MSARLVRDVRGWRWLNRPHVFALTIRCAFTGHNFAQHFTLMGLAEPQDGEHVWCDRCGATR